MTRLKKRLPSILEPSAITLPRLDDAIELRPTDLEWTVAPTHGEPFPYNVRIFSDGNAEEGITGRPDLIAALSHPLRSKSRGKSPMTCKDYTHSLKHFWRFLDKQEAAGLPPKDIMDFGDADGVLFRAYLLRDLKLIAAGRRSMYTLRQLISRAQRARDPKRNELLWPSVSRPRGAHKDVDPLIIRPLYAVLKRQYYSFLQAQEEGARLAQAGTDPRIFADNDSKAAWSARENVVFLTQQYVDSALVGNTALSDFDARFASPELADDPLIVPTGTLGTPSVADRVRWFVPTSADTVAAFLLVLAQFGWNTETAANIDVSSFEAWCDERLNTVDAGDDATVAIYGMKGRVGKEQIGFSRTKPRHHPYQVIRSMIQATEPLRQRLRAIHNAIELSGKDDLATRRKKRSLEEAIASPWLYLSQSGRAIGGRISVLNKEMLRYFLNRLRRLAYKNALGTLVRRSEFRDAQGKLDRQALADARRPYLTLLTLTPSDLRDGFASYIYDASLADILTLKQALGHGNTAATQHYMRQRRQIAKRYEAYRGFQEILWDEIGRGAPIDPTVIFLRATVGEITDAQRANLMDMRLRTRMGMGCLEPTAPPKEISPDHPGGLCMVQRCVLCRHGVLFESSLPPLAVRMAELRFIRARVAQARWWGSSFEYEWIAIEATLDLFDDHRVAFEKMVLTHLDELKAGTAYLFDQVPPSAIGEPTT